MGYHHNWLSGVSYRVLGTDHSTLLSADAILKCRKAKRVYDSGLHKIGGLLISNTMSKHIDSV